MAKKRIALARGGRGKKNPHLNEQPRQDGMLHPDAYHWVMMHKFKPSDDIPPGLIECYKKSIVAWKWFPQVWVDDFGDKPRKLGPRMIV